MHIPVLRTWLVCSRLSIPTTYLPTGPSTLVTGRLRGDPALRQQYTRSFPLPPCSPLHSKNNVSKTRHILRRFGAELILLCSRERLPHISSSHHGYRPPFGAALATFIPSATSIIGALQPLFPLLDHQQRILDAFASAPSLMSLKPKNSRPLFLVFPCIRKR